MSFSYQTEWNWKESLNEDQKLPVKLVEPIGMTPAELLDWYQRMPSPSKKKYQDRIRNIRQALLVRSLKDVLALRPLINRSIT